MAEEEIKQENTENTEQEQQGKGGSFKSWAMLGIVIIACSGAGLGLGHLLADKGQEEAETKESAKTDGDQNKESWYFQLDPVTANLDVPGVTRYVRATLILEFRPEAVKAEMETLIQNRKPQLIDRLTIFLSSLTIDDTRGNRNLRRIQLQILDLFNEMLWPDAKPMIKDVLFKEFAVQ